MGKKYYAVKKGYHTGIYDTWDECQKETKGYSGALYKSFATRREAENYLGVNVQDDCKTMDSVSESIYAFVDGSFNEDKGIYGYGGFLVYNGNKEVLQGTGNNLDMVTMRNVAGEILGCQAAIQRAIALNLPSITIYYDYSGIEMWAKGLWKRNKIGTQMYYSFIQEAKAKININFRHVKGHTNIEGNEDADRLAKQAVGIR